MTSSIRILTTASLDSNPSLLIVSPDGSKTLINCGEGCQRSFLESASASNAGVGTLRISSVNRVCLTHIGHDTLGGLPGMILTTADVVDSIARDIRGSKKNNSSVMNATQGDDTTGEQAGRKDDGEYFDHNNIVVDRKRNGSLISNGDEKTPDLEIIGPEGINTFLHALRHFMRRDRFSIHAHEGQYDSSLNNIKSPSSVSRKKKAKGKDANVSSDCQDIAFRVKSIPIAYSVPDEPTTMMKQAVSYLFTTPPIPGKFLIDKARVLGVPRGPLFAQLKAGNDVTYIDPITNTERNVRSDECVANSSPGVGVAVVYCPTLKVLNELKDTDVFRVLEKCNVNGSANSQDCVELDVMVHLTPRSIFMDPVYQSWCKMFGPDVDHVTLHTVETIYERVVEDENSPFVSGIIGGIRRSFVNNTVYPKPALSITTNSSEDDAIAEHVVDSTSILRIIRGCSMMDYVLMPRSRRGLNISTMKSLYPVNTIFDQNELVNESGAVELALSVTSAGECMNNSTRYESSEIGELIFTGTGSAVPCKHRNVTGMYLRMNNGNSILLDAGEGTVGQLLRSWKSKLPSDKNASDEYRSRLKGIKAVWISHPHADHHLGLLRLLSERVAICGVSEPIILMAPSDMFAFLDEYRIVVPEIHHTYLPVDCGNMIHGRVHPMGKRLYDELGITSCVSIPVAHCLRSYAVIIDGTSFGKVAYSGDCRPSNRFADVGLDTDLLIHEATFVDGMEEDAVLKRHSTVGDAIDVATKMNAKSLVLTHFSQRYPKISQMKRTKDQEIGIPIVFAFDFMRLTPKTVNLAAKLTPAMRLLYPESNDGDVEDEDESIEKTAAKDLMGIPGVFAINGVL